MGHVMGGNYSQNQTIYKNQDEMDLQESVWLLKLKLKEYKI